MIARDTFGIVCQHNRQIPGYLDGGDSANRTAILSISGSQQDSEHLGWFVRASNQLVRHPWQYPWNNPKNCTRDQLIPFTAALYFIGGTVLAKALLDEAKKRNWFCQDVEKDAPGTTKKLPDGPDPLDWGHRLHLHLCAKEKYPWYGYAWLNLQIFWSAKIKPNDEQNQIICQALVAGPKYIKRYTKWHKSWEYVMKKYFNQRDQAEIGEQFGNYIKQTVGG